MSKAVWTSMLLLSATTSVSGAQMWLTASSVTPDSVTTALNRTTELPPQAAHQEVEAVRAYLASAPVDRQAAGHLYLGAILERLGDRTGALAAYKAVPNGTAYAVSAAFRSRVVANPNPKPAELEKVYTSLATESESEGWMLVSGQWSWMTNRKAANLALVDLRSSGLSFRFFSWLRSISLFPIDYSYLFAIVAVAAVVHVLMLPLWFRSLQAGQMSGKLALVELGAAFWLASSMDSFMPQMALDHARFLWVRDATQADLGVLAGFVLADTLSNATFPRMMRQPPGKNLLIALGIAGLGWFGKWGVYWILCVITLRLMLGLSNLAMKPFLR